MTERTFESIYADVPQSQRDALRAFRESHPEKTVEVNGTTWHYLDSGQGDSVLLLLVGGLRVADAAFRNVPEFEDEFRVITPSYPALGSMVALADGLAGILAHEGIDRVHVLAGSFGGMLAQVFIRQHKALVDRVVLSTTALPGERAAESYRQLLTMVESADEPTVRETAKTQMFDVLDPPEDHHAFYRAYLDELFSERLGQADVASTYRAILDMIENIQLRADDLDGWDGHILIIESDDDNTFDAQARERVRERHPEALHYVFEGAGHSPATTQRETYFRVVKNFLHGRHHA